MLVDAVPLLVDSEEKLDKLVKVYGRCTREDISRLFLISAKL